MSRMRVVLALALALALGALRPCVVEAHRGSGRSFRSPGARAAIKLISRKAQRALKLGPVAPSGPPLIAAQPTASAAGAEGGLVSEQAALEPRDDSSASAAPSQGDVLAGNGLASPLCREPAELDASARSSCQTAHFTAGPYPTGNYAFDVNIDTGAIKWSNDVSAAVQNVVQLGWMALVSATRGLVVMLEWCYSLDLPGRQLLEGLAVRLRVMDLQFTQPWLALALSLACVLVIYHGLIRRRVVQTFGHALLMAVMMVAGTWVMLDPLGTIGGLQRWSDQAGIDTFSVIAAGVPERPKRTLVVALGALFSAGVEAPWCYLEFGDVHWCEDPRLLDSRLRNVGLQIAKRLQAQSRCSDFCQARAGTRAQEELGADLLRRAQTNGQLFLALPANRAQRNSVKTHGTLLRALCGDSEPADSCRGPTATQAEFRSANGTYGRAIGLILIWAGASGMLLLFGVLAVRLLLAGVATFAYLLVAPVAVLLPALGQGGRTMFSGWAMRLLLAAVAKLTYSFVLGWTLALTAMLLKLTVLGWWAQWLLVSAFWWAAFLNRRQAFGLGLASGAGPIRFGRRRRPLL